VLSSIDGDDTNVGRQIDAEGVTVGKGAMDEGLGGLFVIGLNLDSQAAKSKVGAYSFHSHLIDRRLGIIVVPQPVLFFPTVND
jgi:hypothetical protein